MYCISDEKEHESDDDDVEWFRQEVGEEPDPDLFQSTRARPMKLKQRKRHHQSGHQAPDPKKRKLSSPANRQHKKTVDRLKQKGKAKRVTVSERRGKMGGKMGGKRKTLAKKTVKLGQFFRTSSHKQKAT